MYKKNINFCYKNKRIFPPLTSNVIIYCNYNWKKSQFNSAIMLIRVHTFVSLEYNFIKGNNKTNRTNFSMYIEGFSRVPIGSVKRYRPADQQVYFRTRRASKRGAHARRFERHWSIGVARMHAASNAIGPSASVRRASFVDAAQRGATFSDARAFAWRGRVSRYACDTRERKWITLAEKFTKGRRVVDNVVLLSRLAEIRGPAARHAWRRAAAGSQGEVQRGQRGRILGL